MILSETEVTNYFQYLWTLITVPVAIIYNKMLNHESRLSKVESIQDIKKEDIDSLQECMRELTEKLASLNGKMDEHLRR